MKGLKLPAIKEIGDKHGRDSKILSMDDYLEFVRFNLRYTFDREAYTQRKNKLSVNVPFKL